MIGQKYTGKSDPCGRDLENEPQEFGKTWSHSSMTNSKTIFPVALFRWSNSCWLLAGSHVTFAWFPTKSGPRSANWALCPADKMFSIWENLGKNPFLVLYHPLGLRYRPAWTNFTVKNTSTWKRSKVMEKVALGCQVVRPKMKVTGWTIGCDSCFWLLFPPHPEVTYNVYPVTPANTQKSAKVNEGLELEAFVKIKKRSPAGGGAKGTKIRKSST